MKLGGLRVLTVCTANMCRSPMAAALLEARLRREGLAGATVSSCGLLPGGAPAAPEATEALRRRGLDLEGHQSRQLAPELVEEADLVLALTREHLREVVVLRPAAFARTFTLRELVRRGERVGPRRAGQDLVDWLAEVGAGRRPQDLLGSSEEDDVADPVGGPLSGFVRTAEELDGLAARLVALLRPGAA